MIGRKVKTLLQYFHTPVAQTAEEYGDEIEAEIAFHLAERTREYRKQGMSEDEARRATLNRFGNASRVAAECRKAAVKQLAVCHRLHLLMTGVLVVAVGVLWFLKSGTGEIPSASELHLPPGIASMLDNDWSGDVTGRILNEQGQPIGDAHVLVVVKTWPDESYFQRAYTVITKADGRFLIENVHPLNERYAVQIAAVVENRVLKSSYHRRTGGTLAPVVFELPLSSGFALQVEAEQGETPAGIEILPHGRIDARGNEHVVYFDSGKSLVRRTDINGRVELPYYQPGDTASVMLRRPQGDWEYRDVVVPAAGKNATIRTNTTGEQCSEEIE